MTHMNKHLFFDYLFSGFNPKEYIKTHKIYSLFDINENDLTNALKKQKKTSTAALTLQTRPPFLLNSMIYRAYTTL